MSAAAWQALTWDVARVGGFVAYGLVLCSVVLGLVLSLRWRSTRYPRFVTNEMHRFVTLLALVFMLVHGVAIAVDPFIAMAPSELLVPFLSHYRPLWVAFGILAAYLAVAVYLSERIRGRIGYAAWRRLHYLAFVVYLLATLHGLGAGSDTRTPWAIAIYAGGLVIVGGLLAVRIRPVQPRSSRRPWVAIPLTALVIVVVAWTIQGPLTGHWSLAAGGSANAATALTSGAAGPATTVPAATGPAAAGQAAASVTPIRLPFQARLAGTVEQTGGRNGMVTVKATFSGDASGHLEISIPTSATATSAPLTVTVDPTGATCAGSLTSATGQDLRGSCSLPDGRVLDVEMQVGVDAAGKLVGTMQVSGVSGPSTTVPR